ncbi:hypothetical protein V7114_23685 [Neobacillus niacini]|uniref:hypothetical protein n=1 Tax=Neobacillus niacini TaxID=86668 RepID=UPI002FFD7248
MEAKMNNSTNFTVTLISFWSRMNSLKAYASSILPLALDKDTEKIEELYERLSSKSDLSEMPKDEFINNISKFYNDIESNHSLIENYKEDFQKNMIEIQELISQNKEAAVVIGSIFDEMLFSSTMRYSDILRNNILISLVSFFELLIGDLLHTFYTLKPNALTGVDKEFSFNDLRNYNNLDEIIESVRNKRVDSILRNSLEEWVKFFNKNFKVDFKTTVSEWDQFNEIFQRRNTLVHNGGRMSNQYIKKVSKSYLANNQITVKEGNQLYVNEEYLNSAIDLFLTSGINLIATVWGKLCPDENKDRNELLQNVVYRLMLNEEWKIAAEIELFLGRHINNDDLTTKFNYWLAMKNLNRLDEVYEEMNQYRKSGFGPIYELCYYGILDDKEQFYYCLPEAVNHGLTETSLLEWPMFEGIRKDEQFLNKVTSLFTNVKSYS